MNIVFFGNSKYSVIAAQIIHQAQPLSLVITNPDKITPKGKTIVSPVKLFGQQNNIPVLETDKIDQTIIDNVAKYKPDFLIIADYGLILPQTLLDVPAYAPLNIHHSLLPKYRGPTPAPSAILAGEPVSGVSVICMTNRVDAGDILAQKEYTLKPDETTDSLLTTLNQLGAEIILPVLDVYLNGSEQPVKQDEAKATLTKRMKKEDGFVDLKNPPSAQHLDRMIRAYYPWPGVYTELRLRDKELRVKFLPEKRIQVEGKKPMSYKDFINGYPDAEGVILPIITTFNQGG